MLASLRISENIVKLRHSKGITQDELADFIGVTKASVSKWENKQSCPDILLLPQLAAYFDVTIDRLMGYEPQLSPEQIKKCYNDLACDFARLPFEQALEKSRKLVREYYSCYPLLEEIVVLWINHFMLSPDKEIQDKILNEGCELCDHILSSCSDVALQNQVIVYKAIINLQQGRIKEVIDALEPIMDPKRLYSQAEGILIQAYQTSGNFAKAELYSQISIYLSMGTMISSSMALINMKMQDFDECQETIKRIKKVMGVYHMENLNPNTALQFHYQCTMVYCLQNKLEEALTELESFVKGCIVLLEKGINLHGDDYFNRLAEWIENLNLGSSPPRNEKVVAESLVPAIENQAFKPLFDCDKYKELKALLLRKIEGVKKS